MKTIVIERTDGGRSVMSMSDEADPAAEITKWAEASGLTASSFRELAAGETVPEAFNP